MPKHPLDEYLCERKGCNHPPSWHRLDSSKNISPIDANAKYRCLGYDCESPGRPSDGGCGCPDYIPPPGFTEAVNNLGHVHQRR
jgi:hypothetical protein